MKTVYRSRISVLLLSIILAFFSWVFFNFIQQIIHHQKGADFVGLIVLVIAFLIAILPPFFMRYEISGDKLLFKFGRFKYGGVNIHDIQHIKRSYNPLASNAASLKRLNCKLRAGVKYPFLLISPVRETEFLAQLKSINPNIIIEVKENKASFGILDLDI